MATRYEVVVLDAQNKIESTVVTGPASTINFCASVARRHAKEYSQKWGKRAIAKPVHAEVVTLLRERIEVPALRRGRPGYRWTQGYYVVDPRNGAIHTPVIRKEAYALARELYGEDCVILIGD